MKPSGKYPALFLQETDDKYTERLRIIYPDGSAEWFVFGSLSIRRDARYFADKTKPCWLFGSSKTDFKSSIQKMYEYDHKCGFEPAIYLGEIK